MTKKVTLYRKDGVPLELMLSPKAAQDLKRQMQACLYDSSGRSHKLRVKIEVHNSRGKRLWSFYASDYLPVIQQEDVHEDQS